MGGVKSKFNTILMGIPSIFKRAALFSTLFLPLSLLLGQEEQKELEWDVLGELSIAYGVPSSYGKNNFLAEGYDLRNATNIEANVLESPRWLIGGQWSFFKGDVVDISKVGGIDKSRVTHLYIAGSYSLLESKKRMTLRTGLGIGYALYRHEKDTAKFRDDGFSILAKIDLGYRISNSFGVFLKLDHYLDFLSIDTAPEIENSLKRTQTFVPFLGIRLYTF